MEYFFDWILPIWLASWLFIMIRIFYPSMAILRQVDPANMAYRWRYLTFLLFAGMALVTTPVMMVPALVDKYRDGFIKNYIKNLIE
tara:strand:- start:2185 stop:2442 length:258 start_codon:yes stop_codon:yes gene_type:complete